MKETIIQFGTGNFLRGFIGHFIHILNEKGLYDGKIVVVQPTKNGKTEVLNGQNGVYNLLLRGMKGSEASSERFEIKSVSRGVDPYGSFEEYLSLAENPEMRFIVSNTTEAGIAFDEDCRFSDKPALSFPGKLTQLLFHRFEKGLKGFIILPCELIDNNGDMLKKYVLRYARLWELSEDFIKWVEAENVFCNTLVDRIVTGYPKEEAEILNKEIGYEDKLLDTAEPFHLWVIEGDFPEAELPLREGGFNVVLTDNLAPFKKMKVRILNGPHTSLVFPSLLCGVETVRESLEDKDLMGFLDGCLQGCILPVLEASDENKAFAEAVLERFANPYIRHLWKSISLNSVSKFNVRVLPSIVDYVEKNDSLPKPLVFSLSCLIEYYKNNDVQDEEAQKEKIKKGTVSEILSDSDLWGADLSFLEELVEEGIERIHKNGIREAIKWSLS